MIPTCEDLSSDRLDVRWHDIFNPPGLTNFLGTIQADRDLTAVRNLSLPPLFTGDTPTGACFVGGEYVAGATAVLHVTWRPDRIVRETEVAGLRARSVTVLLPGQHAVVVRLELTNTGEDDRDTAVGFGLRHAVTALRAAASTDGPATVSDAIPEAETDVQVSVDAGAGTVTAVAQRSPAAQVQGADRTPSTIRADTLRFDAHIPAGGTWSVAYVQAVGATIEQAQATFAAAVRDPVAAIAAAEAEWDAELRAVFEGDGRRFSGTMPVLQTSDDSLRRLYWTGIVGVVCFKRQSPASVVGRTYDTLMPRYWPTVTFLWDYSLSSTVHALLDPASMRRLLRHWIETDIHTCMGTEWLSGSGLGTWYSVNDYAMVRLLHDYLRWTGDEAFLDERVPLAHDPDATVADHLVRFATAYQGAVSEHGLADYGGIDNLLECVSTYVHEVAGLNAANVWCLRVAADVLDRRGEHDHAGQLRTQAKELAVRVQELYVEGAGFWAARRPDGSLVPVRHCYDLLTVLATIPDELSDHQRAEMIDFFHRELESETWMRALSNRDPDASFSVRADHQWNGAYCAWPSETAAGLLAIGDVEATTDWIRRLARSANQGPFGQAHYVESAVPPHAGGARKVNPEFPLVNDWACSSNGSWARLVIEGVFGVRVALDGTVTADPHLEAFDPDARLVGLNVQGQRYTVDASGARADA
ncbi:MAG TPA: hypothetical protein VGA69_09275 [Nitriliruptorales bacterium]